MTGPGWIASLNRHGVPAVAEALGLVVQGRTWGPCPACDEGQRGSDDRRGPIGVTPDGSGWRCHRCRAAGDVASLVALAVTGSPKPDRDGWASVRAWAAGHGFVVGAPGAPMPTVALRPPRPPVAPERPDEHQVRALWESCVGVTQDRAVTGWLLGRCLDPALVEDLNLARALPLGVVLPPWAGTRAASWAESGHRLITPLFGPGSATPLALRARAVCADPWRKALAPSGYSVGGLVFADGLARRLLGGDPDAAARVRQLGVLVVEGEPDWLTWATRASGDAGLEQAPAVVGVGSGAWSDELAALVPSATDVIVRTHQDEAGDRYANAINDTLGDRCRVLRVAAPAEEAASA